MSGCRKGGNGNETTRTYWEKRAAGKMDMLFMLSNRNGRVGVKCNEMDRTGKGKRGGSAINMKIETGPAHGYTRTGKKRGPQD